MARKTQIVTIPGVRSDARGERDNGKTFLLTEFDAVRTEKWGQRALLAAANSGIDIPPEVIRMGMGAVVAAGFRALLTMSFAEAEPLLDEMLQCVTFVPDRSRMDVVRALDNEDIEEVMTLLTLRKEVIELHTGFSIAAFLSKLGTAATGTTPDISPTPTSPEA
jgi:hypothetical protein